ncbi:uncharacterized protein LOC142142816 [Mixophyes fleayi]|uniref:uncharacterized protein LOC142142816 n=1 Tax=Mixophyes fleayi TaxID=3061075 RepID=UPI003F4DA27D
MSYTSYEEEFKQLIPPEVLEGINIRDTDRPVSQPMAASTHDQPCPVATGPEVVTAPPASAAPSAPESASAAPAGDPDVDDCGEGTSQEDPSQTVAATDDYVILQPMSNVPQLLVQRDSQRSPTDPQPPESHPQGEPAPTLADSIRQFCSVQENLVGFHQDSMQGIHRQLHRTSRILQHMQDEQRRMSNTLNRIDTSLNHINTSINNQTGAMREMFSTFIGVVGELITRLPLPTTSAGTSLDTAPSPSLPTTPVGSSVRLRGGRRSSTSRGRSPGPAGKRPK